jgi:hypothetical protein
MFFHFFPVGQTGGSFKAIPKCSAVHQQQSLDRMLQFKQNATRFMKVNG